MVWRLFQKKKKEKKASPCPRDHEHATLFTVGKFGDALAHLRSQAHP